MKKELAQNYFKRAKLSLMIIQTLLIFSSIVPINLLAQNLIDANTLSNPPFNSNYKVGMTIREYQKVKGLWENLNAVQINNKWGVFNANWVLLTPIIFDDVYYFQSGVARVIYNGKMGLVDQNGTIKIQPKYQEITPFIKCPVTGDRLQFHSPNDCNKSFYRIADKWGIIDKNGIEITPAIYSFVPLEFTQGVAVVQKNDRWGMIDSFGNVIVPCIYKKPNVSSDWFLFRGYDAIVFIDEKGMTGIFNKKGEIIVPFSNQPLASPFSDLGATSTGDQTPPVFKVNGKLVLAKNVKRLEPDNGIQLDPFTLDAKNQNSFIFKYYHSVKSQYANSSQALLIAEGQQANSQSSGTATNQTTSFLDKKPSQSGDNPNTHVNPVKLESVVIGSQTWSKKSLNVSNFRNGDQIFKAKSKNDWDIALKNNQPAWCCYDFIDSNCDKFGKIYNWYAVVDPRGVAPLGWHIPSENDWKILMNEFRGGELSKKLKSTTGWANISFGGTTQKTCPNCEDWNSEYRRKVPCHVCKDNRQVEVVTPVVNYSGNGTNATGFSALPGGTYSDGFYRINRSVEFWSFSLVQDKSSLIPTLEILNSIGRNYQRDKNDELHKVWMNFSMRDKGRYIRVLKD